MNNQDYYFEFSDNVNITTDLLEYALIDIGYNLGPYKGFYLKPVNYNILVKDPLLKKLILTKGYVGSAIFRMTPNSCYNWHKDGNRTVTVNLLLNNVESHCYFHDESENLMKQYCEVPYHPNRIYALNVQKEHIVFNGQDVRYVFGMSFNCIEYDTFKNFFLE